MRKTLIAWTATMALLVVGTSTAYHIPEQDDENADGFIARTWTGNGGIGLIVAESIGPFDPFNPQPIALGGIGGILYAASQDFWDEGADPLIPGVETGEWEVDDKKEKKEIDAANQTTTNPDGTWSFVQPYCTLYFDTEAMVPGPAPGDCPATGNNGPLDDPPISISDDDAKALGIDGWFIRVGSNAHSCTGAWDQEFRYKELLAYFHGADPNENGVSGHVTFFVTDPFALQGSYHSGKGVDSVDNTKTTVFCSASNFVGLTDDKTKP